MTSHLFTFESSDLDELRALARDFYYPMRIDLLGGSDGFRYFCKIIRVGPLTVGDVHHSGELRVNSDDLITGYHVNVPLSGRVESEHRGQVVIADPDHAAVYQPVGPTGMRQWSAACRQIAVKIDRCYLENYLQTVLDRAIRAPLDLAPSLDVSTGMGRSWAAFVRHLAVELTRDDSLANHPLVTAGMGDSVIAGLLLAVDHPYREELIGPVSACRPRPVKRAIDAMEADPAYPFSAVDLARAAHVSVRALQEGFRRHTGMGPIQYLRGVRLARVRDELCVTPPAGTTVAEVAHRWGFVHLGRFAASYRRRYGEAPSATLRRER